MGINDLVINLKKFSLENKKLPIRIESEEILNNAVSLVINRSNSNIKIIVFFEEESVENYLFNALTCKLNTNNLLEFLKEDNTSISIITNNAQKFKDTVVYKNINNRRKKYNIRQMSQELLASLGPKENLRNFLVSDEESVVIGSFKFGEENKYTFVNFNDTESCKKLSDFHKKLVDRILNGGQSNVS